MPGLFESELVFSESPVSKSMSSTHNSQTPAVAPGGGNGGNPEITSGLVPDTMVEIVEITSALAHHTFCNWFNENFNGIS